MTSQRAPGTSNRGARMRPFLRLEEVPQSRGGNSPFNGKFCTSLLKRNVYFWKHAMLPRWRGRLGHRPPPPTGPTGAFDVSFIARGGHCLIGAGKIYTTGPFPPSQRKSRSKGAGFESLNPHHHHLHLLHPPSQKQNPEMLSLLRPLAPQAEHNDRERLLSPLDAP